MKPPEKMYTSKFYETYSAGSYRAATFMLRYLSTFITPKQVVDYGCGTGEWLDAALLNWPDVETWGVDGAWVPREKMNRKHNFEAVDLNTAGDFLVEIGHSDFAMCLETAEHLLPSNNEMLLELICNGPDAILFGAAIPGQPGTDHINCRYVSDWAQAFSDRGYTPFDIIRPKFWYETSVPWWYSQNTILYVGNDNIDLQHTLNKLINEGTVPSFPLIASGLPVDVIHPGSVS